MIRFSTFQEGWDKKHENWEKTVDKFKDKVSKEKNMGERDITKLVEEYYKSEGYETITEKNPFASNDHPFDLIAGKITKHYYKDKRHDDVEIIGFEVKSDKDSFIRLPNQLMNYWYYCDIVYLVVHKKKIPKWLPNKIGVLRVSKNNILEEKYAYSHMDKYSSNFEKNILLQLHGLSTKATTIDKLIEIYPKIRRKVLFNRYFASYGYEKYFSFDDDEMDLLVNAQLDYQLELLAKKTKKLKGIIRNIDLFLLNTEESSKLKRDIKNLSSFMKSEEYEGTKN